MTTKKLKIILAGAAFCCAQPLVAEEPVYDLEYETATGWVQVEKSENSFGTAYDNVKPDGTIRLLRDITYWCSTDITLRPTKGMTIDGQGHTMTLSGRFSCYATRSWVFKNITLTSGGVKLDQPLFNVASATLCLDNVHLSNIAMRGNGGQFFQLKSGTIRIVDSTLSNLSNGLALFTYQPNTTGTNRIEIVNSTISGILTPWDTVYDMVVMNRNGYPNVLEMKGCSVTGCKAKSFINYLDSAGSGTGLPKCRFDGCAITNNTFSTAALSVSVTDPVGKVELSGETYVRGNGKEIAASGRPEGLVVRDVTGEVRFASPSAIGEAPFARLEGTLTPTAFRTSSLATSYAFQHDGFLYWTATDATYMDGWPYASPAAAERTARANGKYVFKSSDAFVSKTLSERGEGDVRYVTVDGEFIPEATAAASYAFRVSDGTTNSWAGCADLSAAIAKVKKNSVVELLDDVAPSVSYGVSYNSTICGAGHTWTLQNLPVNTQAFRSWNNRQTFADIIVDGGGVMRKADVCRLDCGDSTALELGPGTVFRNVEVAQTGSAPTLFFIALNGTRGGRIAMHEGAQIENCTTSRDIFSAGSVDFDFKGGVICGCAAAGICAATASDRLLHIGSLVATNNTFSGDYAIDVPSGCPASVSGRPLILDNATSAGQPRGVAIAAADDFAQTGDLEDGAYVTVQCVDVPAPGSVFGTWQAGKGSAAFHPSSKPKYIGKADGGRLVWDRIAKGLILFLR